jgi:hypothetical protein
MDRCLFCYTVAVFDLFLGTSPESLSVNGNDLENGLVQIRLVELQSLLARLPAPTLYECADKFET